MVFVPEKLEKKLKNIGGIFMTRVERLKKRERSKKIKTFALVILIAGIAVLAYINVSAVLFPKSENTVVAEVGDEQDEYYSEDDVQDMNGDAEEYFEDDADASYEEEYSSDSVVDESPWRLGIDATWTEVLHDGYQIEGNVNLWEPIRLTEGSSHPADDCYYIRPHDGYDGEYGWIIPYSVTLNNLTSGFGPFKLSFGITSTDYNFLYSGYQKAIDENLTILVNGEGDRLSNNYDRESDARRRGESYIVQIDGDFGNNVRMHRYQGELGEGKTWTGIGYFVFVDQKRTPEKPFGTERNRFFRHQGNNSVLILAGSSTGRLSGYHDCRRLVAIEKDNEGYIVFGKKYDPVTGRKMVYYSEADLNVNEH